VHADGLGFQVIVNTSKAVTLLMGVYLLKEVANAGASAGLPPSLPPCTFRSRDSQLPRNVPERGGRGHVRPAALSALPGSC
jgi:hypothetical protein